MSDIRVVTREFDTLPDRETFIKQLAADIVTAKDIIDAKAKLEAEQYWDDMKTQAYERIKEEVRVRYKRQSTRDKYLIQNYDKWLEQHRRMSDAWYPMSSVSWSIRPWDNGGCYIIRLNKDIEEVIGDLFDRHDDNRYLLGCKGWYISDDEDFKLILPEELQAEWKEDERKLSEDISRFYRGTTYWGD